jgi:hypothetical protein
MEQVTSAIVKMDHKKWYKLNVWLIGGFVVLLTLTVNAEEVIDVSPNYITGEYTFSGTVEVEMGALEMTYSFSGNTTKETFDCSWISDMGMVKREGSVRINESGGYMKMDGIAEQNFTDPAMAIASATGVSGSSVYLMYSLWKGDRNSIFPKNIVKVVKNDNNTEVFGTSQEGANSITMTLKDGMLVALKSVYEPSLAKNNSVKKEMTEQELKETLKAMGKPQTVEEIEKLRKMMKSAKESLKNLTDKVTTITKITMKGLTNP